MGQYWKPVNLDKKEFLDPHKLGCGLKLWEQVASRVGTGTALLILTASMPEPRGGGDLDNHNKIAKRTIGRWAGDRIIIVGDYAELDDIDGVDTSEIYGLCVDPDYLRKYPEDYEGKTLHDLYTDITDDVCFVIEHELEGKFVGEGWRHFEENT